jgi:hypothetical protein
MNMYFEIASSLQMSPHEVKSPHPYSTKDFIAITITTNSQSAHLHQRLTHTHHTHAHPNSTLTKLSLAHINHAPNAVASLHIRESLVDILKRLPVGNELIDLELPRHVIVDEAGELRAAFDAAERATLPYTTGDELEC